MFRQPDSGMESVIVGAVGILQIEVLEHRLRHEYGVEPRGQPPSVQACKMDGFRCRRSRGLNLTSSTAVVVDNWGRPVLLFENEWNIRWAEEKNDGLVLADIREAMADRSS